MHFVQDPNRPLMPADDDQSKQPQYLEIDLGRGKRWFSRISYALFFVLVAGVLMFLLARFTRSRTLAIVLVSFMVTYMAIMGYWAMKGFERREREEGRWH